MCNQNFLLDKNFAHPPATSALRIEMFKFCPRHKGCHSFCVMINMEQQNYGIKSLPMRTGKLGKTLNFAIILCCLTNCDCGCSTMWSTVSEEWWCRGSCSCTDVCSRLIPPKWVNHCSAGVVDSTTHNRLCSISCHKSSRSSPYGDHSHWNIHHWT